MMSIFPDIQIFSKPLAEVPCHHEFVLFTTGKQWFDGEPEENWEDHIVCILCGYELKKENQNE